MWLPERLVQSAIFRWNTSWKCFTLSSNSLLRINSRKSIENVTVHECRQNFQISPELLSVPIYCPCMAKVSYGTPLLSYYAANALYGVVISIYLVVKSIYCVVISICDMVISIYDVVM